MEFYSVDFLFVFLPLFLFIYMLIPIRYRNFVLIFGSILFYGLACRGHIWQLGLLLAATLVSFGVARLLQGRARKWVLGVSLLGMTALLAFLKCYEGGRLLPPGLSFYFFQIAAYLIDVSRGRISPDLQLSHYAAQIVMFPKLMSGPLVSPKELQRQTWGRGYLSWRFHAGLQKLIVGLALKVLLADRLAPVWNQATILGSTSMSTAYAWLALLAYAMRLYFDFFGYSLMAVGLGQMLGFELPENFHEPYSARSVSEFYRRWHITLGAWFRDYLYIPLGGSRSGTWRTIRNICFIWLLTGLWHGIGGSYLVWAGAICLLILNEKLWLGKLLKKTKVFCHIYTVFSILLTWLPFAVPNFHKLKIYLLRLFGQGGLVLNPMDFRFVLRDYGLVLFAGVFFLTPLPRRIYQKIRNSLWLDLLLFVVFWITVYFLATAKQDPFLYFKF